MDNKAIANVLYETADLQEIDGQDSFRIRSYRNAAQAIENSVAADQGHHRRPRTGAGHSRHRQENAAEFAGTSQRRQALRPRRTAEEISSLDAAVAEDSRARPQDHRPDLERLPGQRRRWRRETGPRRQDSRTAAHGRKARSQAAEGHRRLSPHQRTLPDRRRRNRSRKTHGIPQQVSGHRKDHACRLAAPRTRNRRRSRHSRHRPGLRVRRRTPESHRLRRAISAAHGRHRQRRQQNQFSPAQRHAGGRSPASARIFRRGHAVFHRLEGAQRRPASARAEDGIHPQRIQPGHARGRETGRAEKPKKKSTPS